MKYIIMECQMSYAIALDEKGRFLTVANQHYKVGQTVTEVYEIQIDKPPQKRKAKRYGWIYSLAAAAACLVMIVGAALQFGNREIVFASIFLTINPEIRMDVNKNDVVIQLEALNSEGEMLLADCQYDGKKIDEVMDELVDEAIEMGYLADGGQILLRLKTNNEEWSIEHSDSLSEHLSEYLKGRILVTIKVTDQNNQRNQIRIPVVPQTEEIFESSEKETLKTEEYKNTETEESKNMPEQSAAPVLQETDTATESSAASSETVPIINQPEYDDDNDDDDDKNDDDHGDDDDDDDGDDYGDDDGDDKDDDDHEEGDDGDDDENDDDHEDE